MKKNFEVHFEMENKCLLDCKHCSSYDLRMNQQLNYSLEEAKELISILDASTHVYITGGEPLINKNLHEIISSFKKADASMGIGLFTCGVITSNNSLSAISFKEANMLKQTGLNDVYISVYHVKPELHDTITNQIDSFAYTKESISNLINAGVEVKIHLVLTKQNINELEYIILSLADLGVSEVRLLRLVHNGSAITNWSDIGVSYQTQNKVIYDIFSKRHEFPIKITISGFPELTACRPFDNAHKCQGGTNILYVTLEGEVFPCACTKGCTRFSIGYISEIDKISKYISNNTQDHNVFCLNPLTEEWRDDYRR
ncbi:radical SAM protein [Desulfosporosinus fructosivorans]|uniref:Radical SAM protein n=1 Tax=Desulfosporosinus fructosivorans TaxID=2018669 RepID=A0A4Z0R9G7_9FIRM|nr:radical SAM protein [Desulfosporosinus fructosivorans]TGE38703.1 radical SAM protein [Desulfosporosinus fructosivorans]